MKGRRSLVEGLQSSDVQAVEETEKAFVYGAAKVAEPETQTEVSADGRDAAEESKPRLLRQDVLPQMTGRVPVTVRCQPTIASAIKRISLQRQLDGVEPNTVQDIMEQALENWLVRYGYLESD